MKVEQLFTKCLSEMAYYVSDSGEAAIIDPLRETAPYIEMAKADGAKIKYIFLTHFHADFVSGHVDLAKKTGATIVYGPHAKAEFDFYTGSDNEEFKVGNSRLKLLHTPGHTMESISLLLIDEKGNTPCVFTGDCLFIGDVGRPDLAMEAGGVDAETLAGYLYDSLRNKLMPLPDDIIVYPNHGAGSACGKNIGSETFDSLGNQKKVNYALRTDITKEEFIREVCTGLQRPPQYFSKNMAMNKAVNKEIDTIIERGTSPISAATFKELSEQEAYLVIDTRSKKNYTQTGTVPGAWYIGIDGNFATWVGTLISDITQKILFITDDESRLNEIVTRFARVGYDNVQGYLSGGISAWKARGYPLVKIHSISAKAFVKKLKKGKIEASLDVRKPTEYKTQHVVGIKNFPLDTIHDHFDVIDKDKHYFLHCAAGYRSLIAASIFKAKGVANVTDVRKGFGGITRTDAPLTKPTSLPYEKYVYRFLHFCFNNFSIMSLKTYLLKRNYFAIPLKKAKTNHFRLSAEINGVQGYFILDTGASNTCVSTDLATHFKLDAEESEIKAAGAGATDMDTQVAMEVKIKIGKWKYHNLNMVLFDLSHVNTALLNHHAKPVDGIIGADVLDKGKAIIDYKKKILYLKKRLFLF